MQWIWGDPHDDNDKANACGGRNATGVADDNSLSLYPTRTAIIYLEPLAASTGLQDASAGIADHCASIIVVRVPAMRADELRQRASQLKVRFSFTVSDAHGWGGSFKGVLYPQGACLSGGTARRLFHRGDYSSAPRLNIYVARESRKLLEQSSPLTSIVCAAELEPPCGAML